MESSGLWWRKTERNLLIIIRNNEHIEESGQNYSSMFLIVMKEYE
jgi:hypothetical protein